ncbi:MAG TPA: FIST N-terminal domain-containing protein [Fimbriimonas sp.]|nr:FIST N-terminal domain-containing protein [Fimbriimonas sp.]
MDVQQFKYSSESGWSIPEFPQLDSEKTLVMVFAAPELCLDSEPFDQLRSHFTNSKIIGCSTAGEIYGEALNDLSLAVAVARFEETQVRVASTAIECPSDSYQAARRITEQLFAQDLKAVLVLSDGLSVNGSQLILGLNENLPAGVKITGGLAGDGPRFSKTFVLQDGLPTTNVVSAVGFYGESIRVGCGSEGGWDKFGHERLVTKSQGNVLYELDGMPALDIYKEYLGDKSSELPASALLFPLSIWKDGTPALTRTILSVNEEDKTMTFAGDIEQGSIAQLLYANSDRLILGAASAAKSAAANVGKNSLTIGISCVGRRLVLSDRTEEELEITVETIPQDSKLIGFYSYGEISPVESNPSDLHNQSMTLTTFSEAA